MLDTANIMAGPEQSHGEPSAIYAALMAVKPPELSLSRWAEAAGINRSIFNGIAKHGNPTTQTLEKLLAAIGVNPGQFLASLQPVRTEVKGTGMSAQQVRAAWNMAEAKPVPLLGTAFGGEWSDEVEMTELRLAEVLDYLGRPPSLADDPDAYAVEIIGDSMAPRFEPGEQAFVSPKAAVRPGDDVIVQLRAEGDPEHSDLAGQVTEVLIKRLVKRTSTYVELRQFNPDTTFRVPAERIRRIHRVRGRL